MTSFSVARDEILFENSSRARPSRRPLHRHINLARKSTGSHRKQVSMRANSIQAVVSIDVSLNRRCLPHSLLALRRKTRVSLTAVGKCVTSISTSRPDLGEKKNRYHENTRGF